MTTSTPTMNKKYKQKTKTKNVPILMCCSFLSLRFLLRVSRFHVVSIQYSMKIGSSFAT